MLYGVLMLHDELFQSDWYLEFVRVEGETLAFIFLECRNLCESRQ